MPFFASGCADAMAQPVMAIIAIVCIYGWLAKKYMAKNPEVGAAAKKAVAGKAISIIGKLFK